MDFNINDRVMVKRFEQVSGAQVDMTGFYGHVTRHERGLVYVDLQGCTDNAPWKKHREWIIKDEQSYPFHSKELEHAD